MTAVLWFWSPVPNLRANVSLKGFLMLFRNAASIFALAFAAACSGGDNSEAEVSVAPDPEVASTEPGVEREAVYAPPVEQPVDPFTNANYNEVIVTHVALDLDVLFDEKVLDGMAILDLDYKDPEATRLVLDTNDLDINSVEARNNGSWSEAEYALGADDTVKGAALTIELPDRPTQVRIVYRTSPAAEGLQWLSPAQTAGKEHPFLFSQFQPLYARSMAPLQDTPAVRITYSAKLSTPPELLAVMSAAQDQDGD